MGIRALFQQVKDHGPAMDSIRRLVLPASQGHRASCDDLLSALLAVASDPALAEEALDVLTEAGPRVWIELDSALRPWMYEHGYSTPAPAVRQMGNSLAVALVACGRDGRGREEAVRHPLMTSDVRLVPVLALRTADWAGPVHRRAIPALSEVLSRADFEVLRAVVPVAVRLGERRRGHPTAELGRGLGARARRGVDHAGTAGPYRRGSAVPVG